MGASCSRQQGGLFWGEKSADTFSYVETPVDVHSLEAQPDTNNNNVGSPVSVLSSGKSHHEKGGKGKKGEAKRSVHIATEQASPILVTTVNRTESDNVSAVDKSVARHSTSAPHFQLKEEVRDNGRECPPARPSRARAQTVSHAERPLDEDDISEGELRTLVRSLTRKASGSGSGERALVQDLRNRKKMSQIEDEQVLKLIKEKQQKGDVSSGLQLDHQKSQLEFQQVAEVDPKLAERISARRKTMEHLDIFSPDMRQERISELFDASEKYIAQTGAPITSTPSSHTLPVEARPQQPRRKTLKPQVP